HQVSLKQKIINTWTRQVSPEDRTGTRCSTAYRAGQSQNHMNHTPFSIIHCRTAGCTLALPRDVVAQPAVAAGALLTAVDAKLAKRAWLSADRALWVIRSIRTDSVQHGEPERRALAISLIGSITQSQP
ncbi:hypothetical protein GJAV_G00227030, partial [Gymnothorax javanicus]